MNLLLMTHTDLLLSSTALTGRRPGGARHHQFICSIMMKRAA
jgi:hypothetical protein